MKTGAEERVGCFALTVFLISRDSQCIDLDKDIL